MRAAAVVGLALLTSPVAAEPIRGAAAPVGPTVPPPQQTTATFEDWTLRCVRPERAAAICEVSQTVSNQSQQPVAQTALGRTPGTSEPMRLTVLVPTNISMATAPRLVAAGDLAVDLGWRRCLSNGCVADAMLSEAQVLTLRALKEKGRVVYQDASGREMDMPFSPKGLPAALDALAKEPGAKEPGAEQPG